MDSIGVPCARDHTGLAGASSGHCGQWLFLNNSSSFPLFFLRCQTYNGQKVFLPTPALSHLYPSEVSPEYMSWISVLRFLLLLGRCYQRGMAEGTLPGLEVIIHLTDSASPRSCLNVSHANFAGSQAPTYAGNVASNTCFIYLRLSSSSIFSLL